MVGTFALQEPHCPVVRKKFGSSGRKITTNSSVHITRRNLLQRFEHRVADFMVAGTSQSGTNQAHLGSGLAFRVEDCGTEQKPLSFN